MLGRTTITTAVVALAAAAPATAVAQQDLRSPDTRDAAGVVGQPQDLRSPDARDAAQSPGIVQATVGRSDLRSPDARDAARDIRPVPVPYSPVSVDEPSGFSWGDAGIGAVGVLGLLAIGLGGFMAVTHYRRRHRLPVVGAH